MLKVDLDRWGYKSPVRNSKKGIGYGGYPFSRGLLYKILKNPIYIGKVVHKDKIYDGQHEALIPIETWERVQKHLKDRAVYIESVNPRGGESSLLKGKIFDQEGNPYSPSFTVKDGKRYRYYVSQAVLQNHRKPQGVITRLPAKELEELILSTLEEKLKSGELLHALGLVETDWEFQQILSSFIILLYRDFYHIECC